MTIRGLQLPESFLLAIETGRFRREVGSGCLKRELDSYGNRLQTELGEIYKTLDQIRTETDALPGDFPPELFPDVWPRDFIGPGAIPDIRDFSEIICFASAGGGEPFCFDYRENRDRPSVIWWDDCYWRKISPDFDAFLDLFDS